MKNLFKKIFKNLEKPKFTIRAKLVISFTFGVAFISTFIYFYFPIKLEKQAFRFAAQKAQSISNMTAFSISSPLFFGDKTDIGEVFDSVEQDEDIVYLVVLNDRGEVFSAYNHERAVDMDFKSLSREKSGARHEAVYRTMSPILHNKRQVGRLYLGMSLANIKSQVETTKKTTTLVSLTFLIFGILAVVFVSTIITKPLNKMVQTIELITNGDLSKRVLLASNDEVGHLAASFNAMVANLEAYAEEMKELTETLESKISERTEKLQAEINERILAQEALKKSEKKYRRLIDNSLVGIYITQAHLIKFCNRRFLEIFGYADAAELLDKPIEEMVAKEYWGLLRMADNLRDIDESETTGHELKGIRKDGSIFDIQVLTNSILYQDEPAVQGILIDITERKQAELEQQKLGEQLLQAQKMESIGRLAGGIAHDFNNILGIIIGDAELLLGKFPQENFAQANLKRILTASHRARDMVKQILAFSRKDENVHEQIQLGEVAQDALQLMRSVLPSTIQIYRDIEEKINPVTANKTEIHQVVINLCINAGHAMREKGGELAVSLKQVSLAAGHGIGDLKPGLYQQLSIADTGHGMTPDILQHIFEPYFTTKKSGEGAGMGLAVVHGIVTGYGGEITVTSTAGKGSTFNVFLPVEKEEQTPPAVKVSLEAEDVPGGQERILLVDDEVNLAEMTKEMLESYGYDVDVRNDSLEALEVFQENPGKYNLLISDQTMPNLTGVHLAEKIRRTRVDIPIIICSGFSDSIDENSYAALGINAFVMKPFAGKDLARTVRQVLGK